MTGREFFFFVTKLLAAKWWNSTCRCKRLSLWYIYLCALFHDAIEIEYHDYIAYNFKIIDEFERFPHLGITTRRLG